MLKYTLPVCLNWLYIISKGQIFCVYVCRCMCVYRCLSESYSLGPVHLVKTGPLTRIYCSPVKLGWQAYKLSSRYLRRSLSPSTGVLSVTTTSGLFTWVLGYISRLHICWASTLPTRLCPQANGHFLKSRISRCQNREKWEIVGILFCFHFSLLRILREQIMFSLLFSTYNHISKESYSVRNKQRHATIVSSIIARFLKINICVIVLSNNFFKSLFITHR